jgi:hypothetical protein
MQATSFRLVGQSALAAIHAALLRATSAWAGEWGLAPAQLTVSVERAWEVGPAKQAPAWSHCVQEGGREAWFGCSVDLNAELQKALFGSADGAAPILAPEGARQAREALLDALARAALASAQSVARSTAAEIPASHWRRGGGAVVAQIAIGRQQCRMLLDSAAAQALQLPPAALAPLTPVDYSASVAAAPVSLQLSIGAARVGLGSLMSLSVGDVIRLDAAGDAPVALKTLAGSPVFDAYLGRSGDSVAVELVHRQPSGAAP